MRDAPNASSGAIDAAGAAGPAVARYGLVLVLVWIGGLKFTAYEAEGIKPLISHSPLMSWLYAALDVRSAARVIGTIEIALGVIIALRPIAPRLSGWGSLASAAMFATTLTFLFTTPGVSKEGYGFPALSSNGQFLLKDVILLGVALWTGAEALRASRAAAAGGQGKVFAPGPPAPAARA